MKNAKNAGELLTENRRLKRQLACAKADLEKFRQLYLVSAAPASDKKGFNVILKGKPVRILSAMLAQYFVDCGGKNYIEWTMRHDPLGEFVLTVQRKQGRTPHELKADAENLLYRFARHVRNTDQMPSTRWGVEALELLTVLQRLNVDRYATEVMKCNHTGSPKCSRTTLGHRRKKLPHAMTCGAKPWAMNRPIKS